MGPKAGLHILAKKF